ncbi:MAG: FtsW/RodA/SpoVE family cell cycle protein, partial [Eggerthellaceae bacterium]|nr:FtsW/RodA/SpoVE family cell cycle protein [Eggerthellaceae bacterium]
MTRRNTELFLLLVATPLILLFFLMPAFRDNVEVGLSSLLVPIVLFVAFMTAHLAVRKFSPKADAAIIPIVYALCGIGIGFVTRLAPDLAVRQTIWLFAGVVCMILVMILVKNIDKLMYFKYTLMVIVIILLAAPMLPVIGREISGSRIWVSLGFFSFQPAEFAKLCIIIFLAGYLSAMRERLSVNTCHIGPLRLPDPSALLPLLAMWGVSMLIAVFEKDLGSALIFFVMFVILLYIASGRKLYLVVALLLLVVGSFLLYKFFGHVQARVQTWLDPFQDPQGAGYQICQSLFSLADGGLTGRCIGNGLANLIPVVESDFIFVAIGEEMGLLGAAGVLLFFLCFAIRGFVTASRAKTDISSLVAAGLTAVIVVKALIIVGGVTRLIPLTGITLPFVSQGGSSIMASLIAVGLILRCGDSDTGIDTEKINLKASQDSVLGRYALGKRLVGVMIAFSFAFAVLIANLTYIMVVKAEDYKNLPNNSHTLINNKMTQRGSILTSDGVELAKSIQQEDGSYERKYPEDSLAAHIVGYASEKYGTSGIEAAENDALIGNSNIASFQDL